MARVLIDFCSWKVLLAEYTFSLAERWGVNHWPGLCFSIHPLGPFSLLALFSYQLSPGGEMAVAALASVFSVSLFSEFYTYLEIHSDWTSGWSPLMSTEKSSKCPQEMLKSFGFWPLVFHSPDSMPQEVSCTWHTWNSWLHMHREGGQQSNRVYPQRLFAFILRLCWVSTTDVLANFHHVTGMDEIHMAAQWSGSEGMLRCWAYLGSNCGCFT